MSYHFTRGFRGFGGVRRRGFFHGFGAIAQPPTFYQVDPLRDVSAVPQQQATVPVMQMEIASWQQQPQPDYSKIGTLTFGPAPTPAPTAPAGPTAVQGVQGQMCKCPDENHCVVGPCPAGCSPLDQMCTTIPAPGTGAPGAIPAGSSLPAIQQGLQPWQPTVATVDPAAIAAWQQQQAQIAAQAQAAELQKFLSQQQGTTGHRAPPSSSDQQVYDQGGPLSYIDTPTGNIVGGGPGGAQMLDTGKGVSVNIPGTGPAGTGVPGGTGATCPAGQLMNISTGQCQLPVQEAGGAGIAVAGGLGLLALLLLRR